MLNYNFFLNKLQQLTEKPIKYFLFLLFLQISVQAYSRNDIKVTMGRDVVTIGSAIKSIEIQTGYRVLYDNKLDVERRIVLPSTPMTINSILPLILKGTGCSYTIVNELIGIRYDGISDTKSTTKSTTPVSARYGSLKGVVLDSKTGISVGEAFVMLKGLSDVDLVTDTDGKFIAENLSPGQYDIIVTHEEYSTLFERVNLSGSDLRKQTIINLTRKSAPALSGTQTAVARLPIDDIKFNNTIIAHTPPRSTPISNPKVALKTNLILAATTSLNLAVEVRLSDKLTLDIPVSYNPWRFKNNKLFRHLLVQPELRYWTRESFNGHFFGAHLTYSVINMGNIKMPLGLWSGLNDHRFEGDVFGAGVSYGYQWMLSKRLSMEATVGVGYAYVDYDKFLYEECGKLITHATKHYFGPTKLGLSFIYFIK